MLFGHGEIEIVQGDITEQAVDAIVNAANNDLILGSGVAGAIRTKGGSSIQKECNEHGPIKVGEAALTGAGDLPAKFVIHAASMGFEHPTTKESLINSTKASLKIVLDKQLKTIAFPAIGTGVSGFPIDECAKLMIDTAKRHLQQYQYPKKVLFVLFDQRSFEIFRETLTLSQ